MRSLAFSCLVLAFVSGLQAFASAAESVDYVRDVKPILAQRCYACHSGLKQKGELRLDTGALALKGGESGPALKPGHADESPLIAKVSAADLSERMPPEGKPLTPEQIAILKTWIDQGAKTPADEKPDDPHAHWSFQRPMRPPAPQLKNAGWVHNPIDAFLAAQHERRGLRPVAAADKATLLRRVYLDLVGLPPTRQELQAFLADSSPDAYEKVVQRLLDSPQYGERWARHWMDVWRYSDWYGQRANNDVRNSYPHIWRWRDWIVRSLNSDKGYDRMIVEMLAADEVTPGDDDNVVATGFIVRNWYSLNYNQWMKDTVEHTGKAFLGLTFNCALCHDHKYDPISQEEYFKFRAFFEPLELRQDRVPGLPDPGPFLKYVYTVAKAPIKAGLVRVFDEKLDAQTFMFRMGDERNRVEGKPPVTPGAPAFLGGDKLKIEPVELSPPAYYPGLRPFVQAEEIQKWDDAVAACEAAVRDNRRLLMAAGAQLAAAAAVEGRRLDNPAASLAENDRDAKKPDDKPGGTPAAKVAQAPAGVAPSPTASAPVASGGAEKSAAEPVNSANSRTLPISSPEFKQARLAMADAEIALRISDTQLANARAQRAAIRARIAADNARYEHGPGNFEELAKAANQADRPAVLRAAEVEIALAEKEVLAGRRIFEMDNTKIGALRRAEELLAKAKKALDDGQKAFMDIKSDRYTPLSPVYPAQSTGRRTALARWIASNQNPLTARVAVNHIWSWHFGKPLVDSTFDFGRNGKKPSHPQLLDWLAVELMENGWSMKHLHRLIVTSNAYRMRAKTLAEDEPNFALDRDNRYLWHFNPSRMQAEVVRDSLFYAAGQLDPKIGGEEIDQSLGLVCRRRSLYLAHHAETKTEFLEMFDAPNACDCYKRTETILPQQALALTNSELALNQSRLLARKLLAEVGPDDAAPESKQAAFVQAAFEQILTRGPSEQEQLASFEFLEKQRRLFRDTPPRELASKQDDSSVAPVGFGAGRDTPASSDPAVRACESFVRTLFSHNDFITVY
jgi:hypothetical protein